MLLDAYKAIKEKLLTEINTPEEKFIKHFDWFNDQYSGTIHIVPAVFVEFPVPLKFKTLRAGFQQAPLTVRIHVAIKGLSNQAKTIPEEKLQELENLVEKVFKHLHGFGASYSTGKKLFTSLDRFDLTHHQYIKGWLMTTQDFSSQIYQHEEIQTGTIEEIEITGSGSTAPIENQTVSIYKFDK